MPIEYLNSDNIEEAINLSEKSHQDSAWRDYAFDREMLKKNVEVMIGKPNYFTGIYRKNGKIVGYFFATLGKFLFNDSLFGMENGIYIERDHRGGRVALSMYKEFINWCKKNRAEPLVEIYFGNDEDNEKTYRFFRKIGMVECGRIFRGK